LLYPEELTIYKDCRQRVLKAVCAQQSDFVLQFSKIWKIVEGCFFNLSSPMGGSSQ